MTDKTALEFWRWWAAIRPAYTNPTKATLKNISRSISSVEEIVAACSEYDVKAPYEILVQNPACSRKSDQINFKFLSLTLPNGSLYKLNRGFYVVSPEMLFLRMATSLDIVNLTLLGYEFTGHYVNHASIESSYQQCRTPLTDTQSIGRLLSKCEGFKGIKDARRAIKWVIDSAASPREAELACMLVMPRKMGGYALPKPSLNYRIEQKPSNEHYSYKAGFRTGPIVDIAWPDKRIAIEYDSTQWHSSDEKLIKDSIRRNTINQLGFEVITITNQEFNSASAMDKIVKDLKCRLRVRASYNPIDFISKNANLRRAFIEAHNKACSDER